MRRFSRFAVAAAICLASAPAALAQDRHAFVQGFGGVQVASGPFGGMTNGSFGAAAGVDLTRNIQVLGEVGRMGNVLPAPLQTILSLSPFDARVSAWYGQGGVRLTTGSGAPIQPYVETVAGMARLRAGVGGFGQADPYLNLALGFLTTTRPLATVGGGVVLQGGPIVVDAGYRFSRIFAGNSLTGAFMGGDMDSNQVRVGLGVRF